MPNPKEEKKCDLGHEDCRGDYFHNHTKEYVSAPKEDWKETVMKEFIRGDKEIDEITFTFSVFERIESILAAQRKEIAKEAVKMVRRLRILRYSSNQILGAVLSLLSDQEPNT